MRKTVALVAIPLMMMVAWAATRDGGQPAASAVPVVNAASIANARTSSSESVYVPIEYQATDTVQSDFPYPDRGPNRIKGIFNDHQAWWRDATERASYQSALVGNEMKNTTVNIWWPEWDGGEYDPVTGKCGEDGAILYNTTCIKVPNKGANLGEPQQFFESAIDYFGEVLDSTTGQTRANVTATIFGAPDWAGDQGQTAPSGVAEPCNGLCPVTFAQIQHWADFVSFIANRYDGKHGHGRISDFVIGNEVTYRNYWRLRCGVQCNLSHLVLGYQVGSNGSIVNSGGTPVAGYAQIWNMAYDNIKAQQKYARVMIGLDNKFFGKRSDSSLNYPFFGGTPRTTHVTGQEFLTFLIPYVSDRTWYLSIHPYSASLGSPNFSPTDYVPNLSNPSTEGSVTFGNLGSVVGWLWKYYPDLPAKDAVHLTEQGFDSDTSSAMQTAQENGLCRSFYSALGTPGIEQYIYHRFFDNGNEEGFRLGLVALAPRNYKMAWTTWALADRNVVGPFCGFQEGDYTRLRRTYNPSASRHWVTSRLAPSGYGGANTVSGPTFDRVKPEFEYSWRLLRRPTAAQASGVVPVFECGVVENGQLTHTIVTGDRTCGSTAQYFPLGPVGYAWTSPNAVAGLVPLYACSIGSFDKFVSSQANCEGQSTIGLIGYVLPG